MAHSWNDIQCHGRTHQLIAGSFIPNNASDPATTYGTGFTVTRTGTGVWKVTLSEAFADFVSIVVTGQYASAEADAHQFLVGDISITNKTFEIKHVGSADVSGTDLAAADITASTTARKVNFMCVVAQMDIPGAGV